MNSEIPNDSSARELRNREIRARNRRTGLILATIALAFFIGVMLKYSMLR
jgi:hypothetical protein